MERRRKIAAFSGVAAVAGVALLLATGLLPLHLGADPPRHRIPAIQHVVVILQENHAFDNYFGAYCQATSAFCSTAVDGIPAGACIPYSLTDPASGCVSPYPALAGWHPSNDLPHTWGSDHLAWDQGRMDGFIAADHGNSTPMAYFTNATIAPYWNLAEQYSLGQNFYSGALGASLANHWLLLSGAPPAVSFQNDFNTFVRGGQITAVGQSYLAQANSTPTLGDSLSQAGLSWRVYAGGIAPGGYGGALNRSANSSVAEGTLFDEFDPFLAKASTYLPSNAVHFPSRYSFPTDFATKSAPNVSWVFPSFPQSEHPPGPVDPGMDWALSVVNSVEESSVWNSSLILLTWDEGGGWYDHRAPPNEGTTGPGFRVPLLVISPFAREGFVSSTFGVTSSIARLVEEVFGLPSLGGADGSAPSLTSLIDTSQAPRMPLVFDPNGTYPLVLQPLATPVHSASIPVGTASGSPMAVRSERSTARSIGEG
ncbi:MAG: hypothetical protein L3K07_00850 [Thermoplasmata archaeon]|nr:hypothetical protein [Thermoplasmata archaeon]